ncbi:MAG: SdpI family protein [bacterium]
MNPGQVITWVCIVDGLLFIVLGYPMATDRIKPNPFYGFKLPGLWRDPDAWYRANRVCGRDMMWVGAI